MDENILFQSLILNRLLGGTRSGRIALMYHSIDARGKGPVDRWTVSKASFLAHLDLLSRLGWRTATVSELDSVPLAEKGMPTVYITFDDGYANNWTAFEALRDRCMKATFFIVSGSIGTWALENGVLSDPRKKMLNVTQLTAMKEGGMEIGSHGVSHRALTGVNGQALANELLDSKRGLENLLGSDVTSFAYPYGAYDEDAVVAVRAAGYRVACTCRAGWMQRGDSPLEVRRIEIAGTDSLVDFALKLKFGLSTDPKQTLLRYYWRRLGASGAR